MEFLGPQGWLTGADTASYRRDWLDRYGETPMGVARPKDVAEVAKVLRRAAQEGIAVVPQGGNTGLCGGAVAEGRALILSLNRMARIGALDADGGTIEVEAGVVLADLHASLEGTGFVFPLHLGAEGSARIGGLIGTNAGGSQAFRHGMMGDLVLGMEVVLPDGRIWDGCRGVLKDNEGYGLRRLFAGSEGTLGVVTRAVLRLQPRPRQQATALLALPSAEALLGFGRLLRAGAGEFLSAMEFFCDTGLGWALTHVAGLAWPLESRAPFYLVVELATTSARVALDEIFAEVLETGMAEGLVSDGALAASEAQRAAFWRLREEQPEGQRLEAPQLKHDISVPVGRIAEFLAQGAEVVDAREPGARINPFGHLGDGNIHYNVSPAAGVGFRDPAGLGLALARLAQAMGGSFAAEHGLGRSKRHLADALRGGVEREIQSLLKLVLDPTGRMNPGVLVDRKE